MMTPGKQVIMWLFQFISFFVIFAAFYCFLPEMDLYELMSQRVGFISEQYWNDFFMFSVLAASVFANAIVIFLFATIRQKSKMRFTVQ